MRAIWSGSISFGLVNIPVRLYSASQANEGLDLNMLHKTDMSPIRYARICRADGEEVPWEDIVKGYEYQKGDYVVLTDDDIKKASPEKTQTIDIAQFVDEKEIDSRYYEKPYYLEPDKKAEKPYALLREALRKSGKVALAKYVLRNRERLAAVKPIGQVLVLNQMRFSSELRQPAGLTLPDAKLTSETEVKMALALISQLSGHFVPEDYHDTYTEELEEIIDAKVRGKEPAKTTAAAKPTAVKDLMATLKASLEAEEVKTKAK